MVIEPFCVILFFSGGYVVSKAFLPKKNEIQFKLHRQFLMKKMLQLFSGKNSKEIFKEAGINLTVKKYSAVRNIVALSALIYLLCAYILRGEEGMIRPLITAALVYFLSVPQKEIFKGKKSPVKIIVDSIYKKKQEEISKELVNTITQMKNLVLTSGDKPLSADYILTRLTPYTKLSKPIFLQTHSLIMLNRRKEAEAYFSNSIGTELAEGVAHIIARLDLLRPKEFLIELEVLQSLITEFRQTQNERAWHRKKSRIFLLASLEMIIILMDFVYMILFDTIVLITQM